MKILIKVTKDVLQRSMMCGIQVNQSCAIALAVRDITPNAQVYKTHINWLGRYAPLFQSWDHRTDFSPLPIKARDFINLFDNTKPEDLPSISEFSFEVDLPNEVIDQIGIGEAYRILSESKTLELVHP